MKGRPGMMASEQLAIMHTAVTETANPFQDVPWT